MRNTDGALVGMYVAEDNGIDEGYTNTTSYFRLAAPAGNLTLEIGPATKDIILAANGTTVADAANDSITDCSNPVILNISRTKYVQGEEAVFNASGPGPLVWWAENFINETVRLGYLSGNSSVLWKPTGSQVGNIRLRAAVQGCAASAEVALVVLPDNDFSFAVGGPNTSYSAGQTMPVVIELVNGLGTATTGELEIKVAHKTNGRWSYNWLLIDSEEGESLTVPANSVVTEAGTGTCLPMPSPVNTR